MYKSSNQLQAYHQFVWLTKMFKAAVSVSVLSIRQLYSWLFQIVFAGLLAVALAVPAPEAKADPKAKPTVLAYSAPLVTAPIAYSTAYTYSAPLTYAAAPFAYSAYPAYTAPYVAVY